MTVKIKKVYYCDFCKKHGLTGASITNHELHCTKNPDRDCRMCEDGPLTFDVDIKAHEDGPFSWEDKTIEITGDECPACVLAFVQQNKITTIKVPKEKNDGLDVWNYKLAVERWWRNNSKEW